MPDNKWSWLDYKGDIALIAGVVIAAFFALTSIPHRGVLYQLEGQINSVEYQTKTLTVVKPDVKVFKKIDVTKAENESTKALTDSLNLYFNNVHNQDDYGKNMKNFKNNPSLSVIRYLNNFRTGEGTNTWADVKDPQIVVAYGTVKNPAHADAYLSLSYQTNAPGVSSDGKDGTVNNYWHLDYNLYTHKVNSASLATLSDTAGDAAH